MRVFFCNNADNIYIYIDNVRKTHQKHQFLNIFGKDGPLNIIILLHSSGHYLVITHSMYSFIAVEWIIRDLGFEFTEHYREIHL